MRTAGLTAGRKQALGSTVGEQRSSGLATRAGAATGAATGQQRVTGTTTGAKGTAAGGSGQQRTAGQVAVRKQALAGVSSAQRTTGTTTVRKQAFGATVGQQRVAGSATRAVLAVWFRPPTFKQYFDGPGFGVLMGRVPFDAAYGVLDDGSACSPFPGRQVLFQDEEEAAVRVYTGGSVHGPLTPEEVGRLVAAGYGPSPGPYLSTTPP